jgi:hypothetical protein
MDDLGLARLEIPLVNVTGRDDGYRPRYTGRARWLARRAYRHYEAAFGYTF